MWITPKTNWNINDTINAEDFNRICGNISIVKDEISFISATNIEMPIDFKETWEQYGIPLYNECKAIVDYLTNINNANEVTEVIPSEFKYNYVELNQIETFLNAEHTWYLSAMEDMAYTTEIYANERGYI